MERGTDSSPILLTRRKYVAAVGSIPNFVAPSRRSDDDDTMPDDGLRGRIATIEARCAYDLTPLPAPLPSLRLPGDMISVEFDAAFQEMLRQRHPAG